MTNDVRIQVHWDDPDGTKFQAQQRAKGQKAGQAAGDAFSGELTKKSGKAGEDAAKAAGRGFEKQTRSRPVTMPIKADNPIDAAWRRNLEAAIKRSAGESLKIPATPDTDMFRRDLEASLKKAAGLLKAEVPVKPGDAAKFRADLEKMVARAEAGVKAHIPIEPDVPDSPAVKEKVKNWFSPAAFAGLSLGLPVAAAVGAAGAVAALAILPAALVGTAGMILRNNEQVQSSFNDLSNNVIADGQSMAKIMAGPLAAAGSDLQASWTRLQLLAKEAFRAAVPEVKTLTGTVTDLAEGALPGMVTGLKQSHEALLGVRVLGGEAGKGLGEFFANASQGSAGAGAGMNIFAGTLRMVEARAGTLFANLANGSTGPLTQLHVVLDLATGALLDLTSKGSSAIGFLNGFGSAAGGMMTILRGATALLSALPSGLTQVGGSIMATGMLLSRFGIDAGAGFRGLGASVRSAGADLSGAAKWGTKVGTALGGLAVGVLNPATLAVAALGVGLMILGQRQQAAATDAAAHASRERDLAAALKESKGAVTESVRATAAKKLADYQVSDGTRNLIADTQKLAGEQGVKLLTEGYLGNADAGKKLVDQLRGVTAEHTHAASGVEALTTNFERLGTGAGGTVTAMDDTGFAAKQLADIVEASGGDFQKAQEQLRALGLATSAGAKPMTTLEAAMEGLKDAAAGSEERLSALVDVLNILEGRNATFEEAVQSGNDALRTMEGNLKKGIDHADGFGKSLLSADGSLNTFTSNGSQLQDLATGLQTSFAQAGGSIDEMVRKGMPFDQAVGKVNESLATQRDRFVDIAQKMGLTKTEAQALADKYGLLPKEITSRITADTKQAQDAITALPEMAAATHGAVPISADVNPATNQVNTVVQYADGSTGVITLDGNKDPVTGKVMVAVQYANGQHSYMTIDGFNQAARDRTLEAKRNADGTVAYIIVGADTRPADNEVRGFTNRKYVATVYVETRMSGVNPVSMVGPRRAVAKGGMVGYATGGEMHSVPRLAGGGQRLLDIRPGGLLDGPGTGTSDSILAMTSAGDARVSAGEYVIRASQTRKWFPLLQDINNGVNGFAAGGMVKYGSVSQSKWDSLYASGWRGNPNDGMEALYPPAGSIQAEDTSTASASGGRRSGGTPTVRLEFATAGHSTLENLLIEVIRNFVRVQGGGDVQNAFGRSR